MNRIFLRLLNAPLFLLLSCLLVAIQSTLFTSFPLNWLQPEFTLALVIWAALKRDFIEGGILTLALGYILELHSSSPQGVFLTSSMAIFLLTRLATRLLLIPDFHAWIRLTMAASITWKSVSLLILTSLGKADLQWRHTVIHLLPGAVVTGIAATWTYPLLDLLDRKTHKDFRQEQRLADDIELSENEGF